MLNARAVKLACFDIRHMKSGLIVAKNSEKTESEVHKSFGFKALLSAQRRECVKVKVIGAIFVLFCVPL